MSALIVSIIALVVMLFVNVLIGIIIAFVGLVLGIVGVTQKDKQAIAGLIVSIIVIAISAVAMFRATKFATSTIDNSRKDSFGTIAREYINMVRNANESGEIECSVNASEPGSGFQTGIEDGKTYYVFVTTNKNAVTSNFSGFDSSIVEKAESQTNNYMEGNGKSPWNNDDVFGWVKISKTGERPSYSLALTDTSGHGIPTDTAEIDIKRSTIETENAKADMSKTLKAISDGSTYYCYIK